MEYHSSEVRNEGAVSGFGLIGASLRRWMLRFSQYSVTAPEGEVRDSRKLSDQSPEKGSKLWISESVLVLDPSIISNICRPFESPSSTQTYDPEVTGFVEKADGTTCHCPNLAT